MSEKRNYIESLLHPYPHSYQISCLPSVKNNKCEAILERLQSERKRSYDTDEELIASGNFITALRFRLGHEDAAFKINKELRGLYPANITAKINYVYMSILTGSDYEAKIILNEINQQKDYPDFDIILTIAEVEQAYFQSRTYPSHYHEAIYIYEKALKRFPDRYNWKFGSALTCRRCLCLPRYTFSSNLKLIDNFDLFTTAVGHFFHIVYNCKNSRLKGKSWVELGQLYYMLENPSYPLSRDDAKKLSSKIPRIKAVQCFYNALRIENAWNDEFVLERCGKFLHLVTGRGDRQESLTQCYLLLRRAIELRPTVFSFQQLATVLVLCDKVNMDWQRLMITGEQIGRQSGDTGDKYKVESIGSDANLCRLEQKPDPKEREGAVETVKFMLNPSCRQWSNSGKMPTQNDWQNLHRILTHDQNANDIDLPSASRHCDQMNWTTVSYKSSKRKQYSLMPAVRDASGDNRSDNIKASYISKSLPSEKTTLSRSTKSPSTVHKCGPDNPFIKEASALLLKSIQLSKTCNTNGYHHLGLLYRKLDKTLSAIEYFKTILRSEDEEENSMMDVVNAYEQIGFCLIEMGNDPLCSQAHKQRYRDESKLMMIRSIEQAAILVTRIPHMGPKDHESWQAFPTVKRLFVDEPKTFEGFKEMAQLCELVGQHKGALDFYNDLLREIPEGKPKERIFVKIIKQYIHLNDFCNAQACLRLLMCTSDGRAEIENCLIVYQVYLGAIRQNLGSNDPDCVREDMKTCYQSAFEYRHGRTSGKDDQSWDVFILDDPEQTDDEATALQTWLKETCGLSVTRNEEEVPGGALSFSSEANLVTTSRCLVVVLGENDTRRLDHLVSIARSSDALPEIIVPMLTSSRDLPVILRGTLPILVSPKQTFTPDTMLKFFLALLGLDYETFEWLG